VARQSIPCCFTQACRPAALALVILVLVGNFGIAAPAAGENADWLAGIASVKITPEKPVPLAGYASRVKPFESIDQDIYAKALVLKDTQGARAVLLTIDLCVLPADVGQTVRKRIAEKTQIEEASILLNVAHSHSAPAVSLDPKPESDAGAAYHDGTVEYTKWLCDRLVEVAEQAAATGRMEPARLSWGTGVANFVMNRREFTVKGVILGNNPRGLVDRSVPVLRVDAPDGKPRAVLFGYACHNTTMPANRLAVSGDYEGYAKEYVQQHYPGAQAMFMTGCAGDANPYLRNNYQLTKDYGETLGKEVCRVMETKLQPVRGPLKCAEVTAALPLQTPDRAALEAIATGPKGINKESAEKMLAILDAGGKLPAKYDAPVEAWQFGPDLTLIALPDEVVVEYVQDLERAVGPLRLWVSAYNQEVAGYIPSARILKEGGYETRGLYFGAGWFAPGVEEALTHAGRDAAEKAGREMGKAD
jgi:neutral ceramidase